MTPAPPKRGPHHPTHLSLPPPLWLPLLQLPTAYHATPSASTPATPAGGADSILVLTIKPIALNDHSSSDSEDEDGSELFPYDPLLDDDRGRILDVGCGLYDDHGNLLETCEQLIKPEGGQLLPPPEDSPARKKALQKKASVSGIGWNEAIRQLEPLIRRAGLIVCHDTKVDRQVRKEEARCFPKNQKKKKGGGGGKLAFSHDGFSWGVSLSLEIARPLADLAFSRPLSSPLASPGPECGFCALWLPAPSQ